MKTLDQMKVTNAAIIGDVGYDQITEVEHLAWLNEAYLQFYTRVSPSFIISKRDSIATTSGYALPANLIQLHTIAYDGNELDLIMLDDWKQFVSYDLDEKTPGTPQKAFVIRTAIPGAVYLEPVPDAIKVIKIYYWNRPASLAGGESPIINEEYVPVLEAYARIYCYKKKKEPNSAALEIACWRDAIKTALSKRPVTRIERTREPAQGPRF